MQICRFSIKKVKCNIQGITVRLGTVSVGAIGFMSIRNKYGCTWSTPIFALLIPGHDFFYIVEALF